VSAAPKNAKVFWFFSSEKNRLLLFLNKKKQKKFIYLPGAAVAGRYLHGIGVKRCR
jgi:hypothetical protein